jgi:ADP-ribose diphosphatase
MKTFNKPLPEILARRKFERSMQSEELHLRFSNGVERTFFRVKPSGRGAVLVVPVLDDGKVVLTQEYACGVHAYTLGLPRGRIDEGESVLEAAQREMREETGYAARELTWLRKLALAPNYMAHEIDVVLARDLYQAPLAGDEPEPIETLLWPLAEIEQLALREDFHEGRALGALLLARAYLQR